MNWDELQRKLRSRITDPDQLPHTHQEIGCTLRDGSHGSIVLLKIAKSSRVHSIVDDGTFVRLTKGNKHLTATDISDLCPARGVISADSQIEERSSGQKLMLRIGEDNARRLKAKLAELRAALTQPR